MIALFAASIAVNAAAALLISQPGYMDAYYHYDIAANLASGRGFVEDFVWNYLDSPSGLPHPSNLYWLPLTSILIAPLMAVVGVSFRAAQAAVILLASALPLISYATAGLFGLSARQRLAVALMTIFGGVFFVYWSVPDVVACFAVVGSLALYCAARGAESGGKWLAAAAVFAALGHLARPDGVLLIGVTMVAMLAWILPGDRAGPGATPGHEGTALWSRLASAGRWALLLTAIYGAVLLPWMLRNLQVAGVAWPSSMEMLFIREYNDTFRYGRTLDLGYYLGWGWENILASKAKALGECAVVFLAPFSIYLLPFGLAGFASWRRRHAAWPFLTYAVVLYLVMALLFPFAGPRGSYLHSIVALLPFCLAASVRGIELAVSWTARRLRHWVEPTAQRNFLTIAVVVAVAASTFLALKSASEWDARYLTYERAAAWFRANAVAGARAMVVDPPGWYYSSGLPSVVFANEDVDTNIAICRRFGVGYLILEGAYPSGFQAFYEGKESRADLRLLAELEGARIYEVVP
jgi:hypothetical protein